MSNIPPRAEIVLPIEPGEQIEVPDHAHCSGGGTLRIQVEHVGPTFRWTFGDLWQEVSGVPIDASGAPIGLVRRVVTVRVRAVRRLGFVRR